MRTDTFACDVLKLLQRIEFAGPADYSIGVSSCPYCRRNKASSKWGFTGKHTDDCLLHSLKKEAEALCAP